MVTTVCDDLVCSLGLGALGTAPQEEDGEKVGPGRAQGRFRAAFPGQGWGAGARPP